MRGSAQFGGVVVVGALVSVLGCGSSDQPSLTVTASDVSNLPAGSAVGSAFSGLYVLRSGAIADCNCRVGSCEMMWHVNVGDTFTLTQANGALHVALRSPGRTTDQLYDGGINLGGDFRVGSHFLTETDESYSLLTGKVTAGTAIDARSQITIWGKIGDTQVDCDIVGDLTIPYVHAL